MLLVIFHFARMKSDRLDNKCDTTTIATELGLAHQRACKRGEGTKEESKEKTSLWWCVVEEVVARRYKTC